MKIIDINKEQFLNLLLNSNPFSKGQFGIITLINSKLYKIYYKDFIENFIFDRLENKILATYLVKNTMKNLNNGEITFEDLAPIIYLHYKIFGAKTKKV